MSMYLNYEDLMEAQKREGVEISFSHPYSTFVTSYPASAIAALILVSSTA